MAEPNIKAFEEKISKLIEGIKEDLAEKLSEISKTLTEIKVAHVKLAESASGLKPVPGPVPGGPPPKGTAAVPDPEAGKAAENLLEFCTNSHTQIDALLSRARGNERLAAAARKLQSRMGDHKNVAKEVLAQKGTPYLRSEYNDLKGRLGALQRLAPAQVAAQTKAAS